MPSTYPATLDAFTTTGAGSTLIGPEANNHADAINKIEAELGADPSRSYATVKARIDAQFFDVKAYGAAGDGTTNDAAAIQAALTAAAAGGVVFFPPGDYYVNSGTGFVMPANTILRGCHTPPYQHQANPAVACQIRIGTGFTGTSLFQVAGGTRAFSFENMAFIGNDVGTGISAFQLPEHAAVTQEMSCRWHNCSVMGWSGAGIRGRLHVGSLTNCVFSRFQTYCVETTSGTANRWTDVQVSNCYFAYGRLGGIKLDGTGTSGGLAFNNCRFERAGNQPGVPGTPWNTDAAGVYLGNCTNATFTGCSTDANTGDGFTLIRTASGDGKAVLNISIVGCRLNRDGGADQVTLPSRAAIRMQGVSGATPGLIQIVGCGGFSGRSNDDGVSGIISPKYGIMADYTYDLMVEGTRFEAVTAGVFVGAGGVAQLYRCAIHDRYNSLMTIPGASAAPTIIVGDAQTSLAAQIYYDFTTSKIGVRHGGAWKYTAALV